MSKIAFQERDARYDIPAGTYETVFQGYEEVSADEFVNRDTKSPFAASGPRYRFSWEVLHGNQRGKIIQQLCGRSATPRSRLRAILNALAGGAAQDGVDPDAFRTKLYRVVWKVNPASAAGNCHVEGLYPIDKPTAPAALAAPAAPAKPAPLEPPTVRLYFFDADAGGKTDTIITAHKVQELVNQHGADKITLCEASPGGLPVGNWHTAASYGFIQEPLPF
jgi:hypothetical protein